MRPWIVTGGRTPGTAQLAATASISPMPLCALNTHSSQVAVSTALIDNARAGQSFEGTPRRSAISACVSGALFVGVFSAMSAIARVRASGLSHGRCIRAINCARPLFRCGISRGCLPGSVWRLNSSLGEYPWATWLPTIEPADVPMKARASVRSMPRSARPMTMPAIQATPHIPPPPKTTTLSFICMSSPRRLCCTIHKGFEPSHPRIP